MDEDPTRVFEADKHYPGVYNSHNIASNPETETVFIIGATNNGENVTTCSGLLHNSKPQIQHENKKNISIKGKN